MSGGHTIYLGGGGGRDIVYTNFGVVHTPWNLFDPIDKVAIEQGHSVRESGSGWEGRYGYS